MEGPRRAEDTSNLSDVQTAPGALPRISRSKSSWSVTLSRLPPSEISPTPQSTKCTLCPSCTPSSTTACLAPFTPRSSTDGLGRRERTGRRRPDSGPNKINFHREPESTFIQSHPGASSFRLLFLHPGRKSVRELVEPRWRFFTRKMPIDHRIRHL